MKISIIIPACNEEKSISKIISYLRKSSRRENIAEIIVVDAGSSDRTVKSAESAGAEVFFSEKKSRSIQMNIGAHNANGSIFYFLHSDTFPPKNFDIKIINALSGSIKSGSFRLQFDLSNWFLSLFSWFTRFPISFFRYGDQSLFITRQLFFKIGGFNSAMQIMEDKEIIPRIIRWSRFSVIPDYVVTSARRYLRNGIYRLQFHFSVITLLYYFGFSQKILITYYQRHIR